MPNERHNEYGVSFRWHTQLSDEAIKVFKSAKTKAGAFPPVIWDRADLRNRLAVSNHELTRMLRSFEDITIKLNKDDDSDLPTPVVALGNKIIIDGDFAEAVRLRREESPEYRDWEGWIP